MKRTRFLALLALMLLPFAAHAENPDLSVSSSSISFSTSELYAGDTVRIYASVRNVGDVDVTGYVYFYQGSMPIGRSQTISLKSGGQPDEVFVDFTVPTGSFNIRAIIQGTSPQDIDPSNDVAVTPLYEPIVDADRDGVVDDNDNCVNDANADQANIDGDDTGDACDADIDGDGEKNTTDVAPTNPTVSQAAPTEPAPAAPVTTTQPATTTTATETATAPSTTVSSSESSAAAAASSEAAGATDSSNESNSTDTTELTETSQSEALASAVSKLKVSPNARFTYRQIDWRTFEFTIARQPEDGVEFSWDFGDGASSVQPQITHTFSGSGTYVVTLNTLDQNGNRASDAQTLEISFYHLSNPFVQLILGALFVILAALALLVYGMHKRLKAVVV